jgi:S-layer homology domain
MRLLKPLMIAIAVFYGIYGGFALAADSETVPQPTSPETPVANTTLTPPSDVPLKPDQDMILYLVKRGYFNAFQNNQFQPDQPISRAELIALLYRASGFNTPFTSEFAYFRDVPTSYWAYLPIEGFRVRDMLGDSSDGYFRPENPMTRLDAGIIFSKTLPESWSKLTEQEMNTILKAFPDDTVPVWAQYNLARSIHTGYLLPNHQNDADGKTPKLTLDLQSPLKRMDAVRMVYHRALQLEEELKPQKSHLVSMPEGILLSVSPTSAISQNQFSVGQILFFAVTKRVEIASMSLSIERGSRLHGEITEVSADRTQAQVTLDRLNLPSGESFELSAQLMLSLGNTKNQQAFIVPGQNFPIKTLASNKE